MEAGGSDKRALRSYQGGISWLGLCLGFVESGCRSVEEWLTLQRAEDAASPRLLRTRQADGYEKADGQ